MSPFIAEIIGTMLLILLGNGVVANVVLDKTKGNGSDFVLITLGWGIAVFVGVFVSAPFSGGHINPAVTLSLVAAGKFSSSLAATYILAQFIGGAIGAFLVWLFYRDHYQLTKNLDAKLSTFCTAPAIRNRFSNMVSEGIGTFVLVFAVLYISGPSISTASGEETLIGLGTIGALPVALIVIGIGMSLGGTTGYAINPARDLAPRIMHQILPMGEKRNSDWSYAWIPVLGPVVGGLVASMLYLLLLNS